MADDNCTVCKGSGKQQGIIFDAPCEACDGQGTRAAQKGESGSRPVRHPII